VEIPNMTTFSTNILSCPSCEEKMYDYELNSYTVLDSECFSDGKVENNPIIPHNEQFLICCNCNKEFWKEDNLIASEEDNLNPEDLPKAKDIYDLDFNFEPKFESKKSHYFNNLLNEGFADTIEREVYLRIKLWHLQNDEYRNKSTERFRYLLKPNFKSGSWSLKARFKDILSPEDRIIFNDNLLKLTEIYKPEYEEESLMLAEMHRELGYFKEAAEVLKEIKGINNDKAYRQIRHAIKWKRTKVFKLNKN